MNHCEHLQTESVQDFNHSSHGQENHQDVLSGHNDPDFYEGIYNRAHAFATPVSHRKKPWQDPMWMNSLIFDMRYQFVLDFIRSMQHSEPPSSEKKIHKPLTLTDVETGLHRQKIDRNLSEIAQYILDNHELADVGGRLAVFRQPDWEILDSQMTKRALLSFINQGHPDLGSYLGVRQLEEIADRLLCSSEIRHLEQLPAPDPYALCCSDQLYIWPQGQVLAASSENLRFSHLEVTALDICPAPTPYFDKFLASMSGNDQNICALLLEIIGSIISGYPCKNFFVFEGAPSSGKSQLARFLQGVLGESSCFAVNGVNELSGRWTTGMLPGKLLCLCSGVPDKPLSANTVAIIKQLTGDDPIHGEIKYKNPFVFQNTAKLLFLSNFPLRIAGERQDFAIQQRLVCVPFHRSVPQEEQIPHLYQHLLDEAGGIIWRSLQALADMEERGDGFTTVISCPDESNLLALTDEARVRSFIRERCAFDPSAKTPVQALYMDFLDFERDPQGQSSITGVLFGKILSHLELPVKAYRTADTRGYAGIRLKQISNSDR